MVIAALFGGVAGASDLPDCPKNVWHNCFGTFIHGPKSEWAGDIYQGEYLNGQASGQGTYIWKNGDKYVGEWKSDIRNGKGTFTYGPKSDRAGTIYIGDFKNGRANGKGKAIALDGSVYEGEVKDSERSGQGTFISAEGVVQHGIWKNDKFQYAKKSTKPAPVAKITTRTGVDSSLPDCPSDMNLLRHNCFGTYTYRGNIYVGEWRDGSYGGQGTFTYNPNGEHAGMRYTGEWKVGKWNGQGTLTHQDGSVSKGIWKDDKFQYTKTPPYNSAISSTPKTTNLCDFNNARGCRNNALCHLAVTTLNSGQKLWTSFNSIHVLEAKKRGLSCGVESISSSEVAMASDLPPCSSTTTGYKHNCFDKIWFDGGNIYVGEFKDNERTGQGTYTFGSGSQWTGDKYVGQFKNGFFNGKGTYTWADGKIYVGQFKYDKRTGQGTYYFIDGDKYAGQVEDGFFNGKGTYTWVDGIESYVGEWKNDKYDGQGTFTYADGITSYVGKWKNNQYHGQGTFTWADGSSHAGEWKNDMSHGQGIYTFKDGSTFVGEFKYGEWFKGTLTLSNGGTSITGSWKDKKVNGQGTRIYGANSGIAGTTYIGDFKNNMANGQGTLTWSSGRIQEGIWKDDKFQYAKAPSCPSKNASSWNSCVGSTTDTNGNTYEGRWENGQKHGQGTLVFASGAKYVGGWKYNKRNGKGTYTYGLMSKLAGDKYVGEYRDNKWNGKGTYTYGPKSKLAGDKYVGSWKDDKKNGQGTYTHANGDTYIGGWKDNKENGRGRYSYLNVGVYFGEFKDGKANGQGTFTFSSKSQWAGDIYVGEWKDDRTNGQGVYTSADGSKYIGEFKDNEQTGQGTFTFGPNSEWAGDKYVGRFKDGKRNGQGTYTFADGTVQKGTWRDGEFQYAKTRTQNDQTIPASSGSGFAVSSDGYVITNSHVIDGCQDVFIHTPQKDVKMRVISNDPKNDLALLKGNFKPLAVFSLSTKSPEITQDIFVAGYPFGYRVSSSVKVTKGIISSLTGIGNDFSNFQMDAALQSGNSGGPVLDDMGNVVGVAVAKLDAMKMLKDTGSIPENTNFGIKANVVKSVLDSSSVDVPSENKSVISTSQRAKLITDGTYYISCWMTLAQIEKVRSKKVLFSELD